MRSAAAFPLAAVLASACGSVATGPLDGGTRDAGLVIASRACDAGPSITCFAEVDVRFQAGPLAVDDANVYWVAAGQNPEQSVLLQAGRAGGPVVTLAHAEPWEIATDGQFVYWGDTITGAVNRVPVGGGTVTTVATAAGTRCIAVDDVNVYWTNDLGVFVAPKGGGTSTMLAARVGDFGTGSIVLDSENVYWGGLGIEAVNKVGGVPIPVLTSGVLPTGGPDTACRALAVAGSTVYATVGDLDGGVETLLRVPASGGIATVLDAANGELAVVVGASIYSVVLSPATGVNATPLDGGPAVTLATPATHTIHDLALASDGTLYWTTDTQVQSIKP